MRPCGGSPSQNAGTTEKALVIAACVRQQQSALGLCAFCRWTAARLAAVRVPPSPTVENRLSQNVWPLKKSMRQRHS